MVIVIIYRVFCFVAFSLNIVLKVLVCFSSLYGFVIKIIMKLLEMNFFL